MYILEDINTKSAVSDKPIRNITADSERQCSSVSKMGSPLRNGWAESHSEFLSILEKEPKDSVPSTPRKINFRKAKSMCNDTEEKPTDTDRRPSLTRPRKHILVCSFK